MAAAMTIDLATLRRATAAALGMQCCEVAS